MVYPGGRTFMDALLDERWRTAQPPFDGDCLVADGSLTVDELREILNVTVSVLRNRNAGLTLHSFDDWHQHDAFITERRPSDWADIERAGSSRDSLIAFRQGDTWVHRAFYPENLTFLLRFDIGDEPARDGSTFCGAFDLSADSETLHEVLGAISANLRSQLRITTAKSYFDTTYTG